MEFSTFNIVEKLGTNDYSLWELSMPREQMQTVRQHSPAIEGDMRTPLCTAALSDAVLRYGARKDHILHIAADAAKLIAFINNLGVRFS